MWAGERASEREYKSGINDCAQHVHLVQIKKQVWKHCERLHNVNQYR